MTDKLDHPTVSLQALLQETTLLKDVLLQRVVALAQHVIDRDAAIATLRDERGRLQGQLDELQTESGELRAELEALSAGPDAAPQATNLEAAADGQ